MKEIIVIIDEVINSEILEYHFEILLVNEIIK
jgi:hypothetical protein